MPDAFIHAATATKKWYRLNGSTPSSGEKISISLPWPVKIVWVAASDGGTPPINALSAVLMPGDENNLMAENNPRANARLSADGKTFTYWGTNYNISMTCSIYFEAP